MELAEATRFDMVSAVVNADTQNIDAFDYALQTALTNQADLGIIVWIDDDNVSIFNALTPKFMHKLENDAAKLGSDLRAVAEAMGAKNVTVSVKRGSNLARLTEEVYCDDFSYDLLVFNEEHHNHQQIQHAADVASAELECATVVL